MKKWLILVVSLVFALLAIQDKFFAFSKPEIVKINEQTKVDASTVTQIGTIPTVTRIIDGDTMVILIDGVQEKVRLIGVNTPETVDPRKKVQCFGKEASEFLRTMLLNKEVKIERDFSQDNRDKYGRLLRYVFLKDGTLVNKKIISEGYGFEYTYHTPYKYRDDFKTAEQTARQHKKGLWADGACDKK